LHISSFYKKKNHFLHKEQLIKANRANKVDYLIDIIEK